MKRVIIVVVLALAVAGTAASQQAVDWPQWRGPNGDGTTTETGWNPMALQGSAKILWKVDVGKGRSTVIIKAGRLYTAGGGAKEGVRFWCLDAAMGTRIWEKIVDTGERFENFVAEMWATPATDGERVYWISVAGRVFCLRAADGELLWMKTLQEDYGARRPNFGWAASPVIEAGLLLVNANTVLLALDKATGEVRWRIENYPPITNGGYSTPIVRDVGGIRCAFFVGANSASLIEISTGKRLWSWPIPYLEEDVCVPDPVISDGKVFFSMTVHSYLLDLTQNTPQPLWRNEALSSMIASPIFFQGYLYGTHHSENTMTPTIHSLADYYKFPTPFRCVEFATGKVVWQVDDMKYVSILFADGKLVMLEPNGTLHIAEVTPSGYRELSSADVLAGAKKARAFGTAPVLCNGRIYCRNFDGDLVCIDVSK